MRGSYIVNPIVIVALCGGAACGPRDSYDGLFSPGERAPEAAGGAQGSAGNTRATAPPDAAAGRPGTSGVSSEAAAPADAGSVIPDAGVEGTRVLPEAASVVPVVPAGAGRCSQGLAVAVGTAPSIVDFEPRVGKNGLDAFVADGRGGRWWESHDATPGASVELRWSAGAAGSARAVHYQGSGLDDWGALTGIAVAPCYDASAYGGIGFFLQGNPNGGATGVKLELHTPVTEPEQSGGICHIGEAICHDHFTTPSFLPLSKTWTHFTFTWDQFRQMGWGAPAPDGYRPETQILSITFSPVYDEDPEHPAKGKSFDFSIDEVVFSMTTP